MAESMEAKGVMISKYKSFILAFVIVCFAASFVSAESEVTFAWDPNTEADLFEYRLYRSDRSGGYIFGSQYCIARVPAGTEIAVDPEVPDGTWFWVLTAVDDAGNESGPSNEVSDTFDTTPPAEPCLLRILR